MSQRDSGYAREDRDLYETPAWATAALLPHIHDDIKTVWEPAAGEHQKMVGALRESGRDVYASDIHTGTDFLTTDVCPPGTEAVITNPPYDHALQFIEHALSITKPLQGLVAMLLRTDYDHAKTRKHLFQTCPQFAGKVVLTRRIVWFEKKGASPSFNHAWYIWDWQHKGPPTISYYVEA